jgi:hypothetical protein
MSPQQYRKNPKPIRLFFHSNVFDRHRIMQRGFREISELNPVKIVLTQAVERTARKIIVKWGVNATHYYEYCQEVGCDVWGILTSIRGGLCMSLSVSGSQIPLGRLAVHVMRREWKCHQIIPDQFPRALH